MTHGHSFLLRSILNTVGWALFMIYPYLKFYTYWAQAGGAFLMAWVVPVTWIACVATLEPSHAITAAERWCYIARIVLRDWTMILPIFMVEFLFSFFHETVYGCQVRNNFSILLSEEMGLTSSRHRIRLTTSSWAFIPPQYYSGTNAARKFSPQSSSCTSVSFSTPPKPPASTPYFSPLSPHTSSSPKYLVSVWKIPGAVGALRRGESKLRCYFRSLFGLVFW